MTKKIGAQTIQFETPPFIISTGCVVGKKEGEGPLGSYFDQIVEDEYCGEKSWESAESKLQTMAFQKTLNKHGLRNQDIDYMFAGDLLNQCVGTHYGTRDTNIPFFGIFGACSTMVEGLSLSSIMIDGGFAVNVAALTSSHFCSAEKQFRFPLEYGGQRTPTSQWTVTGSGCAIVSKKGPGPKITHATVGKIVDMGINDANNMGSAMAPAAFDTIITHFNDTGRDASYYDLVITGDLGITGSDILHDLFKKETGGSELNNHKDCGVLIFDAEKQDVHSGGSGCACCASVFCGYLYNQLTTGKLSKILLVATGALMNTMTLQQGETIPSIAHAVAIEM